MLSEAQGSDFAPLLPRIDQTSSLWGCEGTLSLGVSAFGELTAAFATHRPDRALYHRQQFSGDTQVPLSDGRTVTLEPCAVSDRNVHFGRDVVTTTTLALQPSRVTVRAPGADPVRAEFAIVNLWFPLEGPLEFDGLRLGLRPDEPNQRAYSRIRDGAPSPVTHWATLDYPLARSVDDAWSSLRCLAETCSMLCHERMATPCYRLLDPEDHLVEFGFTRSSKWPTLNKAHLRYTLDERSAIETVGRGDVTRRFHELDLGRFVSYILEARRSDLYVEHCLTSVVMALESISSRWPAVGPRRNRRGSRPDDLPDKLDNMNKCLRFIDAKYTGSWLRSLRNDMMHSGEVKGWSVREIDEATNELLVLATDIFFRVFGFFRKENSPPGSPGGDSSP